MAINLFTQYPGQVDPVSAPWPYGEPRNITAPGDGLGTPWEAALAKDIVGLQQALLKSGVIVPSGTPEAVGSSEYLQAIVALASGRAFTYDESGVADAYVLDVRAGQQGPANLFDGLIVKFTPSNDNTGVSTINVAGLGVKNIRRQDGVVVLSGGELRAGFETTLKYNGTVFLLTSDFISGSYNTGSIAAGATSSIDITHGLGTDDVDMICCVYGSATLAAGSLSVGVTMTRPDKATIWQGIPIDGYQPVVIAAPASGAVKIYAKNNDSGPQSVTVKYTIRIRH